MRAVVAGQFVQLGWAVRAFPSATAALAWLGGHAEAECARLVVSDVDMPGLSGHGLATLLRRDYPTLGVLLMSGRAEPGLTLVTAPGAAPMWLLGKPYGVDALADAVARTLFAHWTAPGRDRGQA